VKIDRIEVRRYAIDLAPPFAASWDPDARRSFRSTVTIVESGGLIGVGSGDEMYGLAENTHLFVGRDVDDIERHVRVLDDLQFHYGRMWPLEIALWDLMGKARGEPLWRALGGSSGDVRVYASMGARVPVTERVESAFSLRDAGFPAIKLRFHAEDPAEDIAVVRAVRLALGTTIEILVDANQGWRMPGDTSEPWDFETALRVARELDDLGVYWLEEPLDRREYRAMAELRRAVRLRIAGGEGNRAYAETRHLLEHRSLDVYQQDVAWSTGVLRAMQLAREIQAAGAVYSPHTWGDGLVLLANLHVAAAVSNAEFVEYPYDPPGWTPERRDFVLQAPVLAAKGCVSLGEAPGLGVELDFATLEAHRVW
jgi:L-alanine-DL-glutamate epimerase-like enolase superfamily enzyme